jgi:hypothetical protein
LLEVALEPRLRPGRPVAAAAVTVEIRDVEGAEAWGTEP